VLALDPTLANCYRDPEAYRVTLDGTPSPYPAFVCMEVHERARLVDEQLTRRGALMPFVITYRIESDDGSFTTQPGVLRRLTREDKIEESVRSWCEEFCPEWDPRIQPRIVIDHYEYANDET
jgi:hypothetical protein